ncbi:MAG: TatD family hydrolase [Thermomicrobiales bacterium]
MGFVDTHAHLDDDQFSGDLDAVLERARGAGVTRIVNIGYRPARWSTTLRLAQHCPLVSFTLGLHPHHADEWNLETRAQLETLLDSTGAVALGEIGIDRYRDRVSLAVQRNVFDAQLQLASQKGLPVVIHQRAAEAEVLKCLEGTPRNLCCVFHSFEGSSRMAEFGLDRGYYFGVGGLVTRQRSTELRDVLATIPLDRVLLETDSPYLVPAGVKNRRNEPANLPRIAEWLAELRAVPVTEIQRATTLNAESVFGLLAQAERSRTR